MLLIAAQKDVHTVPARTRPYKILVFPSVYITSSFLKHVKITQSTQRRWALQ